MPPVLSHLLESDLTVTALGSISSAPPDLPMGRRPTVRTSFKGMAELLEDAGVGKDPAKAKLDADKKGGEEMDFEFSRLQQRLYKETKKSNKKLSGQLTKMKDFIYDVFPHIRQAMSSEGGGEEYPVLNERLLNTAMLTRRLKKVYDKLEDETAEVTKLLRGFKEEISPAGVGGVGPEGEADLMAKILGMEKTLRGVGEGIEEGESGDSDSDGSHSEGESNGTKEEKRGGRQARGPDKGGTFL